MHRYIVNGRVHTTLWMHHMDADQAYREKAWWQLHTNSKSYIEEILEVTSNKTVAVRATTTHLENPPY